MNRLPPLIVDLDGSLLRTDTLHESLAVALSRPRVLITAGWQLARHGRAALKRYLASQVTIDVGLLPANQKVVAFITAEHTADRVIHLATGADAALAAQAQSRFPQFELAFASDGRTNLTSQNKADLLVAKFGAQGFDYIGNSTKDRAVWSQANRAYLVSNRSSTQLLPRWARDIQFAAIFSEDSGPKWRVWLKELRIHQSLKNVLLFLPILAAHAFEAKNLLLLLAGFIAFTLMASSVYLLNDLLDLRSDRLHSRKSLRPIASGWILPGHALVASAGLATLALGAAIAIGPGFTIVLVTYAALTCLYSFWLKRVTLVDVTVLAMLYMIRILAGAVIAHIELSIWFTGVTLFLFISLALVKRFTELTRPTTPAISTDAGTEADHTLPGRGYTRSDSTIVLALGVGAGMAVLLLLAIYLQSAAVALLYPSGIFLWLVIPALFYWIGNIWIQAGRGAMHDDPIIFALKNPASLVSGGIIGLLFVAASTPVASLAETVFTSVG